ncbi:MAG TPA: glycosyltransferase family 39 protein [Candidatus Limnocylindrales bacterium]
MAQLSQPIPIAITGSIARFGGRVRREQLAIPGLAVLAGVLYFVNLTVSGFANTYYALAAQAASQSWSALFFGSLDSANFVTLDKPPLAVLPMAIAVKLFGLSSLSILLPEALLGVGTVVVLALAVRRSFGPMAALVAGLVAALSPVAVLIFRYDNPDALLTFLLVAAAYAVVRGLEAGRLRWALLAAVLVGLGFLTKYLQAYLVLPAFALTWLLAAPVSLPRRVGGLVASLVTVLLASGWWVAIVELLPASDRPYIGGSTSNSVLDLVFGYDGLGRIFGNMSGSSLSSALDGLVGSAAANGRGGPSFSGMPGVLRLFNDTMAGQIAWLLPAALLAVGVGLVLHRRARRTDPRLAGYVLWGSWLVTHAVVFSFMSGIIHSYYTVALVPAVGALVGAGAWDLWTRRDRSALARIVLAGGLVATGVVALVILDRTPAFVPGLGFGILAVAGAAALVLALPAIHLDRRVVMGAVAVALVAVLAGPASYSVATMAQAHSGGDVAAGPGGDGQAGDGAQASDPALVAYLLANQGSARWIVAVSGSQAAADIQLAAQQPVMAMGGFTGGDPTPTLAQLQAYVQSGELRYVLLGGGGGPGFGGRAGGPALGGAVFGGPNGASGLGTSVWVSTACTPVTAAAVSGLYDCAGAA